MNDLRTFRITFLSQPLEQWNDWFDFPIQPESSGQLYSITGQVQDLASFLGILNRFQLLNLNPVAIQYGIKTAEPGQGQPPRASTRVID